MLYKVVEIAVVTEESIERELNHWTAEGWTFDSLHFVVRENSRRPSMAFVMFVRESGAERSSPSQG